jgi:hypothetical protein
MKRRLSVATVIVAAAALGLTPLAAQAAGQGAAKRPNPLADPPSSITPSQTFEVACHGVEPHGSDAACDKAALADFDKARRAEGMAPMVLPRGFDKLSVPAELMTLVNIERVDRGLIPVVGMASSLDALTQTAANTDQDPAWQMGVFSGYGGSWSGGADSPLVADFTWMYDDGLGGSNLDCMPGDTSGCWGHRHEIIGQPFTAPMVMGASVAYNTSLGNVNYGTSMAIEMLGGDTTDAVDQTPTWATVAKTMPVELSAPHLAISSHNKKTHSESLVIRSYSRAAVALKVISGAKYWSASPTGCRLAAGKSCTVHVHFRSAKRGSHRGVLRVKGTGAAQHVALVGRRTG